MPDIPTKLAPPPLPIPNTDPSIIVSLKNESGRYPWGQCHSVTVSHLAPCRRGPIAVSGYLAL